MQTVLVTPKPWMFDEFLPDTLIPLFQPPLGQMKVSH